MGTLVSTASRLFQGRDPVVATDARLSRQLESREVVRPRLADQVAWARRFAPATAFDPERGSWPLLQDFTVPLVREFASRAHVAGLAELGLDGRVPPDFAEFVARVRRRTGWEVVSASHEITADRYFRLLAERKFPCIEKLRPVSQVLCGNAPDFWHEAIGHLAPLVETRVSIFYRDCARLHVALVEAGNYRRAREFEKLLWVVLEYGFLRENGESRAFGAAVSGSFVALTKWREAKWALAPFDPEAILASGLFEEHRDPARDALDRVIFYEMSSLADAYAKLAAFASRGP